MMKRIIAMALLLVSTASFAGQCDYSWQTAKDGNDAVAEQQTKSLVAGKVKKEAQTSFFLIYRE